MISRSPVLGHKLIILNGNKCHMYNPEAKDHVSVECPSEFLLATAGNQFFAHKGNQLHIYYVKDRTLKP